VGARGGPRAPRALRQAARCLPQARAGTCAGPGAGAPVRAATRLPRDPKIPSLRMRLPWSSAGQHGPRWQPRRPTGSLLAAYWQPTGSLLAAYWQPTGSLLARAIG